MPTRINIAYLIDVMSSCTAGTEKQLLQMIRLLDRERYTPHLICLLGSDWLERHASEIPCRIHVLNYDGFISPRFPLVVNQLMKIIKAEQIHILQTFFDDSIIVGWSAVMLSRPRPVLITSRRDMGLGAGTPWYHDLYRIVLPIINRSTDGIVANGLSIREYASRREMTPKGRIAVIHNGIFLPPKATPPGIFRSVSSDIWVGIVANLQHVKRIDTFIRALATVKASCNIKVNGIILGSGQLLHELKSLASQLNVQDEVHFLGSVNNVTDYLQHLQIGVLCSEREGFSNSVIEYMACSLPVVASAVGGNLELVDDNNGILFPPGDHEALAGALIKLIHSPRIREEMGAVSRQKVVSRFLWEPIMDKWDHYYMSFMEQEKHARADLS